MGSWKVGCREGTVRVRSDEGQVVVVRDLTCRQRSCRGTKVRGAWIAVGICPTDCLEGFGLRPVQGGNKF